MQFGEKTTLFNRKNLHLMKKITLLFIISTLCGTILCQEIELAKVKFGQVGKYKKLFLESESIESTLKSLSGDNPIVFQNNKILETKGSKLYITKYKPSEIELGETIELDLPKKIAYSNSFQLSKNERLFTYNKKNKNGIDILYQIVDLDACKFT